MKIQPLRRTRGVFLLEAMAYSAIVVLLFSSLIGSITYVSFSLSESTRQEKQLEQRNELTDLLRDDLRQSSSIQWMVVKNKAGQPDGTILRLTQSEGTIVEYAFERRTYDVTYQPKVPPPPPPPQSYWQGKNRPHPPAPAGPPQPAKITQTVEEPDALRRTVFINAVQKSSRRWDYYALNKVERSPGKSSNNSGGLWDLDELQPGAAIDARAAHVFVLLTLQLAMPGKPARVFTAGATTRPDPQSASERQPSERQPSEHQPSEHQP